MGDDWDTVVPTAAGGAGASWNDNNNKGSGKPAGGRGRGTLPLASQMSRVKISTDWEVPGAAAAPPASNSNGWDAPTRTTAASSDEWGSSAQASQFSNDVEDQPRGGGWGSSGGAGGGYKGTGGGNRQCHKCQQEGHMARDCPTAGSGGGSRACHKCQQEGHMARDCPTAGSGGGGSRACHKCQQEGHMARDCPTAGSGGGSRACHKCQQEGHMARDCPTAGSGGGGGPRTCNKCGEEGHMSRECPTGGPDKCFKCKEEGHMSKDCPNAANMKCNKCYEMGHTARECTNEYNGFTEDGKPREQYIPKDVDEKELFDEGIKSGEHFNNFDNIALQVTGRNVPTYFSTFEEAELRPLLLQNIKSSGYVKPTPVQKGSIAVILAGRDLIASAVTGSGKTAAYLVPVMNLLLAQNAAPSHAMCQKPEVVILAPTRELAIQIHREAVKFSHNSVLKSAILYGGTMTGHQRSAIQNGCNILVATTGRLKDFLERGIFDFSGLKHLILDEADRMLDMGFGEDIEKIVNHPTMPPKGVRRTCMFSATFKDEIQMLAFNYMDDYIFVTTGTVGGTNPDVEQQFHQCSRSEKKPKLFEILTELGPEKKTIVFVESKKTADFIATLLCNKDYMATSIHGDRLQSQREEALRDFRRGVRNILVATNVAARGLDIPKVDTVINYDLPKEMEEYVHRVGRTGRVGNTGKSISFFDDEADGPKAPALSSLLTKSNVDVPAFLQAYTNGVGGMGYDYSAPSQGGFASRDVRRFGDPSFGGAAATRPTEAEESWD